MFNELKNEAYFTETQNTLGNNADSGDSMPKTKSAKKDNKKGNKKEWQITRRYKSQFSCQEAIERLIEIHMDGRGSYDR